MKKKNKLSLILMFSMILVIIFLSACQQTTSTQEMQKNSLKIEIRNELEDLQWIQLQVRDFENKCEWLDAKKIQEGERSLLENGKVYEYEFSIDENVMEDIDIFELEISYLQKGKGMVLSGSSSVYKDEWQADKVRKYVIREQVTAVDNAVMPDLQMEVVNRIPDVTGIEIQACDKENTKRGSGYFTGTMIQEDYNKEGIPLKVGKTYKVSIPGKSIQAREEDTIYLKVIYTKTSGESVEIGTFPVTKEECWNERVQQISVEEGTVFVPVEE